MLMCRFLVCYYDTYQLLQILSGEFNGQQKTLFTESIELVLLASRWFPGARFLKARQSFRARKAIFSLSVFKDRQVYTPEASHTNGTSVYIKKM